MPSAKHRVRANNVQRRFIQAATWMSLAASLALFALWVRSMFARDVVTRTVETQIGPPTWMDWEFQLETESNAPDRNSSFIWVHQNPSPVFLRLTIGRGIWLRDRFGSSRPLKLIWDTDPWDKPGPDGFSALFGSPVKALRHSNFQYWTEFNPEAMSESFSYSGPIRHPYNVPPNWYGEYKMWTFAAPLWLLPIPFAVLPTFRFLRWRRLRTRLRMNLCLRCGYDLRGSTGECPECGEEAARQVI